jgi:hypothetical protein
MPAAAPEFDGAAETAPSGWSTPDEESAPAVAGFDLAPPPAADPEPTEEIDPLLLGPPIYDRQNRPLDAPRFTPSARPSTAEDPVSWPATGGPAPEPSGTAPQPAGWAAESSPAPPWQPAGPVGGLQPGGGPAGGHQPGSFGGIPASEAPAGTAQRPPLEPPQLGRPNPPAAPGLTPPEVTQAVPVGPPPSPTVGHQTTTAPLGRPAARPPLEPPQMGQLNRPLPASPAPPTTAENPRPGTAAGSALPGTAAGSALPATPAEALPSGLPGTPAEAQSGLPSTPPQANSSPEPPAAALQSPDAPSGLPAGSGADQTPAPSGLWGVSRNPGSPSGLTGAPSAPEPAWTATPDIEDQAPSGLTFRAETGGDESAS